MKFGQFSNSSTSYPKITISVPLGPLLGANRSAFASFRTEDSFAIGVKTRFLTLLICNWFHLQLVSFAIGVETHGIVLWLHFF